MKCFILNISNLCYFVPVSSFAQCCAGGSGSPIAGGTSQGVLSAKQFEVNTNLQLINSDKFYTADSRDTGNPKYRFSAYQYLRLAYGVTKDFTMSIETGNYFYKEEVGLEQQTFLSNYKSSGISDLVIFPRYDVLNGVHRKNQD